MGIMPLGHCAVYALVEQDTGLVKYVGKTLNPDARFKEHTHPSNRTKAIREWISDLRAKGSFPIFIFLDVVHSSQVIECEKKWIHHFNSISPLLNFKHK